MKRKEMRLRKVQHLVYDIMDEMHVKNEARDPETLQKVIDHLSGAIGDLADPSGTYSLDYLEKKVNSAHDLLFKNKKKVQLHY
ncbi:hypothetical protein U2I54_08340 [Bacillus pseudomycoides]|uniref:Group-specific protein n=1 Tax=Bacillus bingmayongensis TaxID=1150157 RepID=A0ABU5JVH4_9BACI|nr:hypothetical protein [Bacillus pseudomycoides]